MPNCDFYASDDDIAIVLDFVFEQPGWQLVEKDSRPDQPLRTFSSTRAVIKEFDLERESAFMELFVQESGGALLERQVIFRPGAVPGARGRTVAEGWGLIQIYLRPSTTGTIGLSHTNHNTERRAHKWESIYRDRLGPVDAWNWREIERASRRLNDHIRRHAIRRVGSRAVLPAAARRIDRGATLAPF